MTSEDKNDYIKRWKDELADSSMAQSINTLFKLESKTKLKVLNKFEKKIKNGGSTSIRLNLLESSVMIEVPFCTSCH